MPATINGIGTTYYGRRNVVKMTAECQHCNRVVVLDSYETREFFVFVFIPIIPLTKYQILDSCPICRRHTRIKLADFHTQRDATVAQAKAEISGSDLDSKFKYANVLYQMMVMDEAIQTFTELAQADGRRAEFHLGLARCLASVLRNTEAEAAYRQCFGADPAAEVAIVECSELLLTLRRKQDSLELLKQFEAQNATSAYYLAALGDRAFQQKDWETAARVYNQLLQGNPGYADNKQFMKAIKKAPKKANMPFMYMGM